MPSYRVNNIKISFKLNVPDSRTFLRYIAVTSPYVTKIEGNFFVLRSTFVYVIFYTGHVNCTKLTELSDIEKCQSLLKRLIQEDSYPSDEHHQCETSSAIVDNICSSGTVDQRVKLVRFTDYLKLKEVGFRYNPQTFPGLSVKINNVSFTLFNSGKFIAVGAKSYVDLAIHVDIFLKYTKGFFKEQEQGEER